MHAFINTLIHLYNMRSAKKQKQPLQGGGRGFGNAEKLPERFSSIDDLLNAWAGNQSASNIIKTAKYMGIELRHLGNSTEEINDVIGRSAFKFSRKDRGYCKPVYAVVSLILAKNEIDTAKWLIGTMIDKVGEKDTKNHLTNISRMMEEAKNMGLEKKQLGSIRDESTADEIVRVATNPKYKYPKNAVAVVIIGQKADGAADLIMNNIIPNCTGTELFDLASFIKGCLHKNAISREDGLRLLENIEMKLNKLWMGS